MILSQAGCVTIHFQVCNRVPRRCEKINKQISEIAAGGRGGGRRRNNLLRLVLVCRLVLGIWRSTGAPKEVAPALPHSDFRSHKGDLVFFFAPFRKKMHALNVPAGSLERASFRQTRIANLFTRYSSTLPPRVKLRVDDG